MDGWMDGRTDGWTGGQMHGWIGGWMCRLVNGWMDGRIDRWIEACGLKEKRGPGTRDCDPRWIDVCERLDEKQDDRRREHQAHEHQHGLVTNRCGINQMLHLLTASPSLLWI